MFGDDCAKDTKRSENAKNYTHSSAERCRLILCK